MRCNVIAKVFDLGAREFHHICVGVVQHAGGGRALDENCAKARAGLNDRDYDQVAIVSANVGNTLPVVGLFTGGPQVAAALLVFSQIFRKPLKDMGQIYYSVNGGWDEPDIATSNSQRFAEISGMAGCIKAAE